MRLKTLNHVRALSCALLALYAWTFGAVLAQPPRFMLDAITPNAAVAGGGCELRAVGRNSQHVDRLVFNHPGIRAELKKAGPLAEDDEQQYEYGSFQVNIASDVPPGIYEVHAVGKYGVSNPRLIAIAPAKTQLFEMPASGAVNTLQLGSWITGKAKRQDRLRIPIQIGSEPAFLVCITTGLDSMILPRIVLRNDKGIAVQTARWQDRLPIVRAIPSGFTGFIELSDELYRGGEAFPFLIGLSATETHPFQDSPFFAPPSSVSARERPKVNVTDRRNLAEQSSNQAYVIQPPCEILLDRSHNVSFQWRQAPGVSYDASVFSHAMGHSTDIRLTAAISELEPKDASKPSVVGEDSPATGSKGVAFSTYDPRITISIPADSAERLVTLSLSDLQSRSSISSPGTHPLRLLIAPPTPRFDAIAHWSPWTNNPGISGITGSLLTRGGQVAIHVAAVRSGGFAGDIDIVPRANNAGNPIPFPESISFVPCRIAAGQNEGVLLLTGADTLDDQLLQIELIATAKIADTTVEKVVSPATIFQSATAERGQPLARIASSLWLRTSKDLEPITIRGKAIEELTVVAGEKIAIPLSATRRAGGEAKCILRGQYVPPKCTLPDIELAPNGQEVAPELTTAKDTPPGLYTICFQGEMVWKISVDPESHTNHVAYRDRLIVKKERAATEGEKTKLDQAIAAANMRIEQLAKEIAPRDFPTFFYTAPVRIRVLPPKN